MRPEILLPKAYRALDVRHIEGLRLSAPRESPFQVGQRASQSQHVAGPLSEPLPFAPIEFCPTLMQEVPKVLKVLDGLVRHADRARCETAVLVFGRQVNEARERVQDSRLYLTHLVRERLILRFLRP